METDLMGLVMACIVRNFWALTRDSVKGKDEGNRGGRVAHRNRKTEANQKAGKERNTCMIV